MFISRQGVHISNLGTLFLLFFQSPFCWIHVVEFMMIAKVEVVYLFFSSTFFSIFFNSSCFFGTGLACSDHLDRNHPDGSQENNPQVQCRGNSGGRGLGVGFGHEISSIQGWFDYHKLPPVCWASNISKHAKFGVIFRSEWIVWGVGLTFTLLHYFDCGEGACVEKLL